MLSAPDLSNIVISWFSLLPKISSSPDSSKILHGLEQSSLGGACGVIMIVIGNVHGNQSSGEAFYISLSANYIY